MTCKYLNIEEIFGFIVLLNFAICVFFVQKVILNDNYNISDC